MTDTTTTTARRARQRCETCGRSRYVDRRWRTAARDAMVARCTECGAVWPTKRTASAVAEADAHPPLEGAAPPAEAREATEAPTVPPEAEREYRSWCCRCAPGSDRDYTYHLVDGDHRAVYRLCHGCGTLREVDAVPHRHAVAEELPRLDAVDVEHGAVQSSKLRSLLARMGADVGEPAAEPAPEPAAEAEPAAPPRPQPESEPAPEPSPAPPPVPPHEPFVPVTVSDREAERLADELSLALAHRDVEHRLMRALEQVADAYDEALLAAAEDGDLGALALAEAEARALAERRAEETAIELRSRDEARTLASLLRLTQRVTEHERRRLATARDRLKRRMQWVERCAMRALEAWAQTQPRDTKTAIRLGEGARLQWRRVKAGWRLREGARDADLLAELLERLGEVGLVEAGLARYELKLDRKAALAWLAEHEETARELRSVEHQDEHERLTIYGL